MHFITGDASNSAGDIIFAAGSGRYGGSIVMAAGVGSTTDTGGSANITAGGDVVLEAGGIVQISGNDGVSFSVANIPALTLSTDGVLASGPATTEVRLVATGLLGAAHLSSAQGPAAVTGAGASLKSTSSSEGVSITTTALAGDTSSIMIASGSAGAAAGDIIIEGGDGGTRGGSVILRAGASSGVFKGGSVDIYDSVSPINAPPLVHAGGVSGGLHIRGLASLGMGPAETPPSGSPLLVAGTGASLFFEVTVPDAASAAQAIDFSSDVTDGLILVIINSPSSAFSAVLKAGDVLACDDDVELLRGRGATFITWGCAAGACKLLPLQ